MLTDEDQDEWPPPFPAVQFLDRTPCYEGYVALWELW